jgi:tetratricopeptide (TPR) repeat protein
VACLTDGEWQAFAAGHLDKGRIATVEAHLADCEACRLKVGWSSATAVTSANARTPKAKGTIRFSGGDDLARGTTVGRYLVLERLGVGGMGKVYAAYDPQLDRKIALKLLRDDLGRNQRQFRARMLREAQAMARLAHPNVIAVHDVGTFGKRVFLAMELVEGGTLKSWLRQKQPAGHEILEVFIDAGRGLAAAHAAGLVHRDFKPENVLLGADGRARVTDFGLARSSTSQEPLPEADPEHDDDADDDDDAAGATKAGAALPEDVAGASLDTPLTRAGTMMGTPGYMPPEQCRGGATDERADQFSFCASLYEALYGFRAFPGLSADEVIDSVLAGKIREAPADSKVPAWVRRVLLRGLSVDPAARWPSMDALLAELGRDPARRRRRWLATAGLVAAAAALVAGAQQWGARGVRVCSGSAQRLAGAWDGTQKLALQAAFAKSGKPYAAKAAEATTHGLDDYAAAWVAMHGDTCEATRIRGEQAESVMALRMACLDQRRQELAALVRLFAAADDTTVERAVQAVQALPPVSACANVQALTEVTPEPADPSLRAQIAEQRTRLASARARLAAGQYADGLKIAEEVPPIAATIGYRPLAGEALELLGQLRFKAGDYHGADRAWRDALYAAEESHDDATKSLAAVRLANVTVDLHGYAEAHEWMRFAEASVKRSGGAGELQVDLWISIALIWFRESRYADAEQAALQAVKLAAQSLPEKHLGRAYAYRTLGDVLKYEGRYEDGLQLLERARSILEGQLGPDHPEVASILRKEIDVFSLQHDGARGLELGRRVLALLSKSLPPGHLQIAQTHTNIAESLGLLGRYDEALAEEKLAEPTYERVFGAQSENVGVSYTNMGYALMQLGRDDEARRDLNQAIAIYEKTLSADAPDLAEPILRLGQLELRHKRPAEAARLLERALALRQHDSDPTEMLVDVELALAKALVATSARPRALTLASRAHDQLAAAGKTREAAAAAQFVTDNRN